MQDADSFFYSDELMQDLASTLLSLLDESASPMMKSTHLDEHESLCESHWRSPKGLIILMRLCAYMFSPNIIYAYDLCEANGTQIRIKDKQSVMS